MLKQYSSLNSQPLLLLPIHFVTCLTDDNLKVSRKVVSEGIKIVGLGTISKEEDLEVKQNEVGHKEHGDGYPPISNPHASRSQSYPPLLSLSFSSRV
jgi:hypothetical protein